MSRTIKNPWRNLHTSHSRIERNSRPSPRKIYSTIPDMYSYLTDDMIEEARQAISGHSDLPDNVAHNHKIINGDLADY